MPTEQEIMNIHVRALFTNNAESRLLSVNEPGGSTIPASRLFLGRTQSGSVWRFRADLPQSLIKKLDALCADEPAILAFNEPPRHFEKYVRLLEQHAPVQEISAGPAYHFAEYTEPSRELIAITKQNVEILRDGFEDWIAEAPTWQPFVALIEENRAVSICCSVRITPEAHEAGVETLPDFRGKGYAKDVVARWAHLVRDAGALPLYSTSWENTASQAVARKLRLRLYGADFQIA